MGFDREAGTGRSRYILNKKFIKSRKTCKVTFELPKAIEAKKAAVAGEFSDWEPTPLKKVKGTWKTTVELEQGKEFQYRYVVNDEKWINDWNADKYVPNHIDGDNSVVVTYDN